MSTKSSLAWAEEFHLYTDYREPGKVFLRLDGTAFEATNQSVTVQMPVALWEFLRTQPAADFNLADKPDEELRAMAVKEADEAEAHWRKLTPAQRKRLPGFLGGDVGNVPRSVRIRRRAKALAEERRQQRELRAEVDRWRWRASDEGQAAERKAREEKFKREHPDEWRKEIARRAADTRRLKKWRKENAASQPADTRKLKARLLRKKH